MQTGRYVLVKQKGFLDSLFK